MRTGIPAVLSESPEENSQPVGTSQSKTKEQEQLRRDAAVFNANAFEERFRQRLESTTSVFRK